MSNTATQQNSPSPTPSTNPSIDTVCDVRDVQAERKSSAGENELLVA
jgi:hypothetical protein